MFPHFNEFPRAHFYSGTYRWIINLLHFPLWLSSTPDWHGLDRLPESGGFLIATNHISEFDPLAMVHPLVDRGFPIKVLAKQELFRIPVVGWLIARAGHIPVDRSAGHGGNLVERSVQALQAGECIAVFPEGTLTRDPYYWPMRGRTGIARMALAARVPVYPMACWGAHLIIPRYTVGFHFFPRKRLSCRIGESVDLSDLYDRADDPVAWREATDRIMAAITEELQQIRGGAPRNAPVDVKVDAMSVSELRAWDRLQHKQHRRR